MAWLLGYVLARQALKKIEDHRTKSPIDHPQRSVTRDHLEYPTTGVSFIYLAAIGKLIARDLDGAREGRLFTVDSFTDRAVITALASDRCRLYARYNDANNLGYMTFHAIRLATADHKIQKYTAGTLTDLATEAVDLGLYGLGYRLSVSGSTISSTRTNAVGDINTALSTGVTLTATDTDFAAGLFGARDYTGADPLNPQGMEISEYMILDAPASTLPPARLVAEVDYVGSGRDEFDPIRPVLPEDLVCVQPDLDTNANPRCQLADGSEGRLVNRFALTWGAFEFKPGKEPTVVVIVQDAKDARAIDALKTMAKRVLPAPKTYDDAVVQFRQLARDHPHWIAGKDNYAYHTLGSEEYEVLAVADFYYGFLIEHRTRPQFDQLKRVPPEFLEETIEMWLKRLRKLKNKIKPDEAEKHEKKLKAVKKLGW